MIDLASVGAGAAGLMAGIQAGRTHRDRRIVLFEGAKTLGAKILVAGGGRCNVTHDVVDENAYAGSSRKAIGKVLRSFDVARTIAFFAELGVDLKREETGKLFPTTDRARTVLDALLRALADAGAELRHPCRVESVVREGAGFRLCGAWGEESARHVVLATGGKSLPKSGSDGHGFEMARSLGHTITPRLFPALVALTLAEGCFVRGLSGLTLPTTLTVRASSGKRLVSFTASTLCTHFGLSGPGPMDISRYLQDALLDDPEAQLVISWLPEVTQESVEAALRTLSPQEYLARRLPARLTQALFAEAGVDAARTPNRDQRRALVTALTGMVLPVTGNRGYTYAEATAGGVPLSEVRLQTMESRLCPGLFLCGELCDVDGRIGGFNFQWAWSSGFVAGGHA